MITAVNRSSPYPDQMVTAVNRSSPYPDQMITAVTRSSPYPDQMVDHHLETTSTALNVSGDQDTYAAFPLLGTIRFGMARLGSGWFAFPLQFSTALEWVGLFTCRYS